MSLSLLPRAVLVLPPPGFPNVLFANPSAETLRCSAPAKNSNPADEAKILLVL